jgi:hypothetical protein
MSELEPTAPPAKAETADKETKPVKPPKAAKPEKLTLEKAVLAARSVIGSALRQMVAARVEETDPNRLKLENTYETVRAEIAQHQFTLATLREAAEQAGIAITVLANNTNARQDQLQALRGDAGLLGKWATALAAEA